MILSHIIAAVTPTFSRSLRRSIVRLGGLGLIPLGLLDNSIIPLPGSMDVVLIILCARQQDLWFYYSLMATVGAIIGGFVTYRLARKGGEKTLERRFPRWQVDKVTKAFERWGFSAVAIPALVPPPFPITPFLIGAGAMQYPVRKFLAALALGRIVRYTILGYLAALYGRKIIAFFRQHEYPVALTIVGAVVVTALLVFYFWRGARSRERTAS
jgi:membrane protein YqaA with SNARE-associated domain